MSGENETRKLLRIRTDLEGRIERLEEEIQDIKKAIMEIDKSIVRQGFRRPSVDQFDKTLDEDMKDENRISMKTKDGVTLGFLSINENEINFHPVDEWEFTLDVPPLNSFFIERVLSNMKTTDEEKATRGEIPPDKVFSYEVITEGDQITGINIKNYGGERRLREIRSSLRWALEKMYEKLA